jgi:protocatechuate 3,4-dioxygenase beta subunit
MQRKIHLKRTASFSVVTLLVLTLFTAFNTPKTLAEVAITQISPSKGPVGTVVTVTGQITTPNGFYKVFFGTMEVKNGTATQTSVSTTFTVPNSTFGKQLVWLHDVANSTDSATVDFHVQTNYIIKALTPSSPQQIQEGVDVTIVAAVTGGNSTTPFSFNVTVTDPNNVAHSANNVSIPSVQDGYGEANRTYPKDFGQNAHTYYNGSYKMELNIADETHATGSFTIGLTNATEYHRFQTVFIQAANYTTSDLLTVRITHISETFELPPSSASIPLGIITANWTIPANASLGVYTVEVEKAKPLGFEKPVSDTQTFKVISKSFTCEVRALNLDNETVEGVLVEAWNATTPGAVTSNTTNANGTAFLSLKATDYTFKAYWNVSNEAEFKEAQVGRTSWISVGAPPEDRVGIHAINITCALTHLNVAVKDIKGAAVPFAEVQLSFTYTNRLNKTSPLPPIPLSLETDLAGKVVFRNMYANINYNVTASRYGNVFASRQVANLTETTKPLDIECPTYRLVIKVYDRNGAALQDAQVEVYEWSMGLSGLVGAEPTGSSGEAAFNSTFGKYFVDVYKNDMLVNHTVALLIDQITEFSVHCKLYSLTLNVNVIDYFGLGIPNANVTIEREGAVLSSSNTGSNGVAQFTELVGGDYRIFVYIGGKPYLITTMYLQEPQTVSIKISDLVSIGGFTTETSYFLTAVLITLLIIALLSVFLYQRLKKRQKKE